MNKEILIYAFRYALGRQSIAPLVVVDYILENIDKISEWDLNLIRKEISIAIECWNAWSEIDVNNWKRLLNN